MERVGISHLREEIRSDGFGGKVPSLYIERLYKAAALAHLRNHNDQNS